MKMMRKLLFHKLVGKRPSPVGGREVADCGRKVIDDHKYQHDFFFSIGPWRVSRYLKAHRQQAMLSAGHASFGFLQSI